MSTRTVAAGVAQGDGLGEGHVQAEAGGDGPCHLSDLQGVRHPGPLVVLGEYEDLGLAGQAAKCRGVEDPVAVALEAGPERVWLLGEMAVSGPDGPGGSLGRARAVGARPRAPVAGRGACGGGVGVAVGGP
jgi:hypothetical protein